MADNPVRKRTRRAAKRIERQRRRVLATPTRKAAQIQRPLAQTPREQRGPGFPDLPPRSRPEKSPTTFAAISGHLARIAAASRATTT